MRNVAAPSPQIERRGLKRNSSLALDRPFPAKPSRLQSNQPLHMTTRRAASRAATNSTAASITSVTSRRNSLRDTTQKAGVFDIDVDRPTKRARLSDRSSTTSETKSAVRRLGSTTPIPDGSNQDANIPDIVATPDSPQIGRLDSVTPPDDDSFADEHQDEDESDVQRLLSPLRRRRGRRPNLKGATTPTGSVADSLIPGTPLNEDLDDNDSDHDLPKASRRLPGRRRAPNADPYLEACLRRQLQLRMTHRAVSKALKPVLIELAIRTSETLEMYEDDEDTLEVEQQLSAELESRLEIRLRILGNELRIMMDFYDEGLQQDEEYLRMQHKVHFHAMRHNSIMKLMLYPGSGRNSAGRLCH
jgi:hypothetical protein